MQADICLRQESYHFISQIGNMSELGEEAALCVSRKGGAPGRLCMQEAQGEEWEARDILCTKTVSGVIGPKAGYTLGGRRQANRVQIIKEFPGHAKDLGLYVCTLRTFPRV